MSLLRPTLRISWLPVRAQYLTRHPSNDNVSGEQQCFERCAARELAGDDEA